MSSVKDTASFFTRGNSAQFEHVLALYPQVLKLKAENKCKKPDELIRLDDWYQNKLPQLIKKRGKDRHIVHEELVKTMKWKQTRGKFFPQLSYLIKVNTPRAVQAETRKAFRKLPNLEQAITALSNLKGVGTTMASALLAAAAPETAPFMADECLMAIPEIEGIDYTTREYMNFVRHIRVVTDRLNRECHPEAFTSDVMQEEPTSSAKRAGNGVGDSPNNDDEDGSSSSDGDSSSDAPVAKSKPEQTTSTVLKPHERKWSPHKVELALWTHYVASELQPDLLESVPEEGNHTDEGEIPATSSINTDSNPTEDGSPTKASNGNASKSLAMTEGNHAIEEPSDESNCDAKSTLGSDDSSKDLKFGVDSLDDCTKSEDSMEHPSVATLSCSTRSPSVNARKTSAESANARSANESSDVVVDRTPKPSIDDELNNSTEEDESDDEPPSNKRTKFG